ncbi:hypothetical protein B0T18DRAFT_452734 [Schizothecium vesticola]|uniref:Uncharacterized protein n=1 Tax=Schizothecium vesticola TaxID=314040 RepID=A0AA40F9Q4_9PEZI|nr:hypothetical protein B0T18DRAFT_452734 [Schizothecium vesticola]
MFSDWVAKGRYIDPSLRTIRPPVGDPRDAFDVPVPEVRATTHSQHDNFDRNAVTHVVIQVTYSRQAVFADQQDLKVLNFVVIRRREFISYTTSTWKAAADVAAGLPGLEGMLPLNVIEASFPKLHPGQPIKVKWAPARAVFTTTIREANERHGKPLNHQVPNKEEEDQTRHSRGICYRLQLFCHHGLFG